MTEKAGKPETPKAKSPYYEILLGEDQVDLMDQVNERLKEGWELQGGVAMVTMPGEDYGQQDWLFAQAVVLRR